MDIVFYVVQYEKWFMYYKVDIMINVCGFLCPEPMVIIRRGVRRMNSGGVMLILADDPVIRMDILIFSRFMKHELLMQVTQYVPYCYLLQKNGVVI